MLKGKIGKIYIRFCFIKIINIILFVVLFYEINVLFKTIFVFINVNKVAFQFVVFKSINYLSWELDMYLTQTIESIVE